MRPEAPRGLLEALAAEALSRRGFEVLCVRKAGAEALADVRDGDTISRIRVWADGQGCVRLTVPR